MKNSLQHNFTFFVIPVTSSVSSFSDINLVEWKFYVVCCVTELHHIVQNVVSQCIRLGLVSESAKLHVCTEVLPL
jgi:hypothetical protein